MRKREPWLDALRLLAAFLVIVNHTNSEVFQASSPAEATWWLSMVWYYVSKLAVPLFVMVSGAVLLPKQDSLKKIFGRFLRVLAALVVFSYGYFLHDAWVNYGLWPRMANIGAFVKLVWTQQITDGFWYLYFYMGLMLALPLLQRMASAMKRSDMCYLMGLCFGLDALWPLAAHYVPALALPSYFDMPFMTGYIGLFFAGHWIRTMEKPVPKWPAVAALLGAIAASVVLTRVEFGRVLPGAKYWFMDNRTQPSLFVVIASIALMMLMRGMKSERKIWTELGGCAFGIYLLQDWVIAQTETRLFAPLCQALPAFPAVLVWEVAVFAICLAAALVMKRIPLLAKIL